MTSGISSIGKRRRLSLLGALVGLSAVVWAGVSGAAAAPVGLGTATSFAVLAGAGVTNTGPSVVNGDLGTCPTPAITGFPPGTVNGTIHADDPVACQAQSDLTIAYNDAAGRAPTTTFAGPTDLGGMTLKAGVYNSPTSFAITGTLTLDAEGDPNAVFIFQAGSTLITAPNSRVVLINGTQACNVFWKVGSSATLGVGSTFVGSILALTAITANTDANVQGRLLARNAAVTLDSNTVTSPQCAPPTTTTSSTTVAPTSSTTAAQTTTTAAPTSTTTAPSTTTLVPPTTTTTTTGSGPTTTTVGPGVTTTTVGPGVTTTTVGTGATTPLTSPTTTTPGAGTGVGGGNPTTTSTTVSSSTTTISGGVGGSPGSDIVGGAAPDTGSGSGNGAAPAAGTDGDGAALRQSGSAVVTQARAGTLALTGAPDRRMVSLAGWTLIIGSLLLLLGDVRRAPAGPSPSRSRPR